MNSLSKLLVDLEGLDHVPLQPVLPSFHQDVGALVRDPQVFAVSCHTKARCTPGGGGGGGRPSRAGRIQRTNRTVHTGYRRRRETISFGCMASGRLPSQRAVCRQQRPRQKLALTLNSEQLIAGLTYCKTPCCSNTTVKSAQPLVLLCRGSPERKQTRAFLGGEARDPAHRRRFTCFLDPHTCFQALT